MQLGDRGVDLIKGFEGFRSRPYRDAVGVWTIGYGSTRGVGPGTAPVSQSQAEARLRAEVDATYGKAVNGIDGLNQNQYDALTSFVYNVGPGGIGPGTGIGKALRAKRWNAAADELLKWDKAGGRALPGLTRRRRAERKLFLTPVKAADALSGYTEFERRWIRQYDELQRQNKDADRRRVLRRVMGEQAQRIRAQAAKDGWNKANRRKRYQSLEARST